MRLLFGKSSLPSFPSFPTPSDWPLGRMLLSPGRPCPSEASWSALLRLASDLSHIARLGVSGFGYFCRNNSGSAAGTKPGKKIPCHDKTVKSERFMLVFRGNMKDPLSQNVLVCLYLSKSLPNPNARRRTEIIPM